MRYLFIVLCMLFGLVTPATAQVSDGIGQSVLSIVLNLLLYPELDQVPGYPVYYAPGVNSNYFFYDGMYWVYQQDNWYASSWYNGPWGPVRPEAVPLYVLRIPVRYYRDPPEYFRGWRPDAPPRWGEHWGNEWEQHRRGWDKWNRGSVPAAAPLPVYQRQYSGDRYPRVEQQSALHRQNYRYQPRDPVVRQHYKEQAVQRAPAPSPRGQQQAPQERSPGQQDMRRSNPPPSGQQSGPSVPRAQPPQRRGEDVQKSAPTQTPPQRRGEDVQKSAPTQAPPQRRGEDVQKSAPTQTPPQRRGENVQKSAPTQTPPQRGGENAQKAAPMQAPPQQRGPAVQDQGRQPRQGAVQREPQAPRSGQQASPQGKGASQEPGRGQGPEKDRERGEERGQERNR